MTQHQLSERAVAILTRLNGGRFDAREYERAKGASLARGGVRLDAREYQRAKDGRFGTVAGTHHTKVKSGAKPARKKATEVEKSRAGLRAAIAKFKADPSEANRAAVKTAGDAFSKSLQGQSSRALAKAVKTHEPDLKAEPAKKEAKPKPDKAAAKAEKEAAAQAKLQAQLAKAAEKEKAHQEKVRAYKEAHAKGDEKAKKALKLGIHAKQQAEREIANEARQREGRKASEALHAAEAKRHERVYAKLGGDKFTNAVRSDDPKDQRVVRDALRSGVRKEFEGMTYKEGSAQHVVAVGSNALMATAEGRMNEFGMMIIRHDVRDRAAEGPSDAAHVYVHEELHAHGPLHFGSPFRYTAAGAVVEEVATEVLARRFTEKPLHGSVWLDAYQTEINDTLDAFRKAGAADPEAALVKAAHNYKKSKDDFNPLHSILADSAEGLDRGILRGHLEGLVLARVKDKS